MQATYPQRNEGVLYGNRFAYIPNGICMHPKTVNSTYSSVEIHPYVQARLRALSRRDEPSGILLGTSDVVSVHITGFKRVPATALRHGAETAGVSVVGFYRLFTPQSPMLTVEEEELLQQAVPHSRAVFLLIHTTGGIAHEAIAWIRDPYGEIADETVPLISGPTQIIDAPPASPPPVSSGWRFWGVLVLTAAVVSVGLFLLRLLPRSAPPVASPPDLTLDLHSRNNELAAVWELGSSSMRPQSAYLIVREGNRERVTDLTASFTSQGRVVVHPSTQDQDQDVVVTLQLNFPDAPPVSRSATYVGFAPPPAMNPVAEVELLRRRNKELEDANAALRRHIRE